MTADSVFAAIEEYGMLSDGDKVVVGLSGGADSVCLLHILVGLREKYNLTLTAAHVNHGIRGQEADRDEDFCVRLCKELSVPLEILHADVPALSKERSQGLEECGRTVRYEFFASLAGDSGKIAVAHNMNDVAETLLFNLARGTSLKGAGSIAPVRDNIIRPLIKTGRQEIEDYLAKNGLSYVTDSTNFENEYSRNKIRNCVLPVLEEINPLAVSSMAAFCETAREDEALLDSLCNAAYEKTVSGDGLDAYEFGKFETPIKKRVARKYLEQYTDADILSKHISDFIRFAKDGGALQTVGALRFVKRNKKILPFEESAEPFKIEFSKKACTLEYPYGSLIFEILDKKDLQNLNKNSYKNCIDCDKIADKLILRSRKEGDSITLSKRAVTKTLKKLFNEDSVEPHLRNTVPVLESDGQVVWVGGYGTSKKYAVGENTEKALIITRM